MVTHINSIGLRGLPCRADARTTANEQALLCGIQREWLRTDIATQAAINHLLGVTPGGLNGPNFLKEAAPGQTVFDDTAQDRLTRANGSDWFLLNLNGGTVRDLSDRTGPDTATAIQ